MSFCPTSSARPRSTCPSRPSKAWATRWPTRASTAPIGPYVDVDSLLAQRSQHNLSEQPLDVSAVATYRILEGTYQGTGLHSNGSRFSVSYQVKRIVSEGADVYCVWIARNEQASLQARSDCCRAARLALTHFSLKANDFNAEPVSALAKEIVGASMAAYCADLGQVPFDGEFIQQYDVLEKIGTGSTIVLKHT